jgi:tungstate transport system permease protein
MPTDVSALSSLTADPALIAIVRLSLIVTFQRCSGRLIGVPSGAFLALVRFLAEAVIVVFNALMGLPPVVVGFSSICSCRARAVAGPPVHTTGDDRRADRAIAPIIAALTRQTVEDVDRISRRARGDGCRSVRAHRDPDLGRPLQPRHRAARRLRRAAARVGAVLIVGGNIDGFTAS